MHDGPLHKALNAQVLVDLEGLGSAPIDEFTPEKGFAMYCWGLLI